MNETSPNCIGRNIKAIRTNYGFNQEEFADLAGASQASVFAWECGASTPRQPSVIKIVSALPGLAADGILSKENGFVAKTTERKTADIREPMSDSVNFDPVKAKLDASYNLMSDETRGMMADLAVFFICNPVRRR